MDLVAELSANSKAHKEVISMIPLVAHAAHYKHYTQHLHLMETVCTQVNNSHQLPHVAMSLNSDSRQQYARRSCHVHPVEMETSTVACN